MNFKDLKFELHEHILSGQSTGTKVAVVTLNRPKRANSITPLMAKELLQIFDYVEENVKTVRVLILTGAGKYFCAGMDLQQASSGGMEEESSGMGIEGFQQMFSRLANLSIPTVCLFNGPALGGGVGLFFACDIRIACSPNGWICLSEVKRGLVPALISPWIVAEVGKSIAMEMFLSGEKVSVTRLYQLGIVSTIVGTSPPLCVSTANVQEPPVFSSREEALKYYLDMLVSSAPLASAIIKKLVRRLDHQDPDWEAKLKYVRELFPKMMQNEEASYGMMAFLQKRKPNWVEFHSSKL